MAIIIVIFMYSADNLFVNMGDNWPYFSQHHFPLVLCGFYHFRRAINMTIVVYAKGRFSIDFLSFQRTDKFYVTKIIFEE